MNRKLSQRISLAPHSVICDQSRLHLYVMKFAYQVGSSFHLDNSVRCRLEETAW